MSNSLQNTKTRKMTEGDPLLTIFRFALPMICSNLFQQMYHMVDTIIVGQKLGTDALAAVGSASSITAMFVQLSTGLALGGSIVIAQYFGAGQGEKIWSCTTTSAIFCGGVPGCLPWADMYMEAGKRRRSSVRRITDADSEKLAL